MMDPLIQQQLMATLREVQYGPGQVPVNVAGHTTQQVFRGAYLPPPITYTNPYNITAYAMAAMQQGVRGSNNPVGSRVLYSALAAGPPPR